MDHRNLRNGRPSLLRNYLYFHCTPGFPLKIQSELKKNNQNKCVIELNHVIQRNVIQRYLLMQIFGQIICPSSEICINKHCCKTWFNSIDYAATTTVHLHSKINVNLLTVVTALIFNLLSKISFRFDKRKSGYQLWKRSRSYYADCGGQSCQLRRSQGGDPTYWSWILTLRRPS